MNVGPTFRSGVFEPQLADARTPELKLGPTGGLWIVKR
jgi:hypothetical protein